jgi:Flp pilus assembly protein CpaB
MGRRPILILIIVLGILILAAVVVVFILNSGDVTLESVTPAAGVVEDGTPVPSATATPEIGATVNVVVSNQRLPRGYVFPATMAELEALNTELGYSLIITESRKSETVASNVITNIEDVLGRYARNVIFQGETLTDDGLADDPTPPGSVAAAIPMDRLNSVAYALDEGDHIDIMITFLFYQIDEEFQTYLQNAGIFFIQETLQAAESAETTEGSAGAQPPEQNVLIISPYGRFERLPTDDLAHISPSEFQRPIPISMILQNAKVIQVGAWKPPELVTLPTPTPTPSGEEAEAAATPVPQVTPIPEPPDVLLVSLSPQQQLLVKYAVESYADIDFALRDVNDGQLYTVENIDLDYMLQRFGFEVPANSGYSVDIPNPEATATPEPTGGGEGGAPPEGS